MRSRTADPALAASPPLAPASFVWPPLSSPRGASLPLFAHQIPHAVDIAAQEALHIVLDRHQRQIGIDVAEAAEMRRDDDVLHSPQWMIRRQRLGLEHVERRARD